jgi:RsiW-degrading membrane proteinase PrsW (M82 family)
LDSGGLNVALVGIGTLQTVVYLLFIRAIDLYEREELRYVIPIFLWGMTGAVVISLFFNTLFVTVLSAAVGAEAGQT